MASLTIRFDLGPGISPAQFARLTADFSSFVDLAQRWAERDALRNATEYIRRQAFSEIDRSRYQLRESDIADLSSFNELVSFWDEFGYALPEILLERNWYRYVQQLDKRGRANLSPLAPLVGPPSLESFAPELFSRLVAQEALERRPRPLALDSVHYQNPIEITLQDGVTVGSLLLGTGAIPRLLEVLKDYTKAGRRRRSAEADEAEASARLKAAEASEAEASARLKAAEASEAELRLELLESLARYEFSDGPQTDTLLEVIDENNDTLKMLARIAELEPTTLPVGIDE